RFAVFDAAFVDAVDPDGVIAEVAQHRPNIAGRLREHGAIIRPRHDASPFLVCWTYLVAQPSRRHPKAGKYGAGNNGHRMRTAAGCHYFHALAVRALTRASSTRTSLLSA